MLKHDFEKEMGRLKEVYGDPKYPEERVQIFWRKFKDVPYPLFRSVTNRLIGNEPHAPMFAKFEVELGSFLKRLPLSRSEVSNQIAYDCHTCKKSGLIFETIKTNGRPYQHVFRCCCEYGAQYPNYPKHIVRTEQKCISN